MNVLYAIGALQIHYNDDDDYDYDNDKLISGFMFASVSAAFV